MATLDDELFDRMWARLRSLLDEEEDTLHVFPLCENCDRKVLRMGRAELPVDRPYYIL